MKTVIISAILCLFTTDSVHAQNIVLPMPSSWNENLNAVLEPIFDVAEPYKTFENTHYRGVPVMHEDLSK